MARNNRADGIKKTAKQIKRATVLRHVASIALASMLLVTGVTYAVSVFFDNYSSFSMSVMKYDMVKQGLTLSASPEFDTPTSKLNADAIKNCTNISGDSLPGNIDSISGQHNGDDYIAYTCYLKNMGEDTVTYQYKIELSNVTKGVDEAVRFRLFVNGEPATYAKTKKDGSGPELGTTEFISLSTVLQKQRRNFAPGDVDRFTIVIWLEGDEPEWFDDIIGGRFNAEMIFEIVEGS